MNIAARIAAANLPETFVVFKPLKLCVVILSFF